MQIVETLLGRTMWVADLSKINPAGLALGPIHRALLEKYAFLQYPDSPATFDFNAGIRYRGGEFSTPDGTLAVDLTIYYNGWTVDTTVSTDVSDAFLHDISSWLTEAFALRNSTEMVTKVLHESHVVLTSDSDLLNPSEPFSTFSRILGDATNSKAQTTFSFKWNTDPPDGVVGSFVVERRVGTLPGANTYFSTALVSTREHAQLLERFEQLFV